MRTRGNWTTAIAMVASLAGVVNAQQSEIILKNAAGNDRGTVGYVETGDIVSITTVDGATGSAGITIATTGSASTPGPISIVAGGKTVPAGEGAPITLTAGGGHDKGGDITLMPGGAGSAGTKGQVIVGGAAEGQDRGLVVNGAVSVNGGAIRRDAAGDLIIQGYTSAIAGRDGGNVVIASGQKTGTGEITDGSVTITSKSGVNIGTPGEPTDLYAQGNIFVPHGYVKIGQWTFQQVADASPPPDYVFAKEYELRGLDSVESFIQQNKHLPDVPSAKEFQEKGGNIVEMNYTLLRKIEELTLYVIEQNKQIEKLQAAVSK